MACDVQRLIVVAEEPLGPPLYGEENAHWRCLKHIGALRRLRPFFGVNDAIDLRRVVQLADSLEVLSGGKSILNAGKDCLLVRRKKEEKIFRTND
ncbi:MAG: hypothetical protein U5K38_17065 [Woeseiaceae bacterium]|nr:hypothetical protein [Woeseiaceae bacterium]